MNENFHYQHQADSTNKTSPAAFTQQDYSTHSIKRNEGPPPLPTESSNFDSNNSHAYNEETIHKVYMILFLFF